MFLLNLNYGYWQVSDICRAAGIARPTMESFLKRRHLPRPSHTLNGNQRKYYTAKEAEDLIERIKELLRTKAA